MTATAVEVVAHRGASAYAVENTFAAHDLALEQGADVLELDLRATGDGELVLAHDPTLLRVCGDPRHVGSVDRAAIAGLPRDSRPPGFEDFLARYAARTRLLVDLKDPAPAWERRIPEALERHGLRGRAVVQSFDVAALRRLHEAAPWLPLAVLYGPEDRPRAHLFADAAWAAGVGCWHGHVDAGFVAAARALDLAVRAWTVDDPAEMARLAALGVDAIITNAPDVAVAATRAEPLALAA